MEANFNFNSQVCTNKVQSERLLALGLKKETADMVHFFSQRDIAHIIRCETGCGMMEATVAIEKLIEALKNKPLIVMDNPPQLKIIWEQNSTER